MIDPRRIRNLLVVVAMDTERDAILSTRNHDTTFRDEMFGVEVRSFDIGNHRIYVVKSGVGPVRAAVNVALVTKSIDVDAILLTGVGGALDSRLQIGDVVISKYVLHKVFLL